MADGTVNTGGSSMPPSNPVKVIKSPSVTYGQGAPPMNIGTGVPGTAQSAGAPTMAPSQTMIETGGQEAVISKDIEGQQGQPPMAAQPPNNGTTGPKIAEPSVDYDSQQGSRIPAEVGTAQHRIIAGEQDQQLQDKAGA